MARQSRNFHLPLKNITASFNTSNMSFSDNSEFTGLLTSPMSNLAFNLSELSTGRNTPRRRLSLTIVDTPPNNSVRLHSERSLSVESGCDSWSPLTDSSPVDSDSNSTASVLTFDTDIYDSDIFGSEKSLLGHGSKMYVDDACSQDSGLGFEHDRRSSVTSFDDAGSVFSSSSSLNHLDRLPLLEDVWNTLDSPSFKTPKGIPPKRSRSLNDNKQFIEDTCSPIKYSPVKSSSLPQPSFSQALFFAQVPEAVAESTESNSSAANDGFHELFKLDHNEADDQLSSLISTTLLHQPSKDTPETLPNMPKKVMFTFDTEGDTPSGRHTASCRSVLKRSQSLNIQLRPPFKRCDPPSDSTNPVQNKKWRGDNDTIKNKSNDSIDDAEDNMRTVRRMHRCHSETEAMIKSAISLMYSQPDLIGDCSKTYCLPTVIGKHQDLKSISPETLSHLMADAFSDVIEKFQIVDCRYPYEYEGGHIQNAVNIYTKDEVVKRYIKAPLMVKDLNKRIILVFHCEFSSERGPGLIRFLRGQDRETNKEHYPFLHYPEIYLLEGGYKNFFQHFSHLCEPRQYKTMYDKNHTEDLRKFRAKCKSWSDDKTQPRTGVRNLKF